MRPLMRPCCINTYIQTVCGGLVVACVTGCGAWHFSVETRMEGKLSKLEEKMDRKFTEMDNNKDNINTKDTSSNHVDNDHG